MRRCKWPLYEFSGITKNILVIFYTLFGVNHGSRAVIGDLCETQTAECGVSRKRVIGASLLLELIARGENRLFSPEKVRPICFCGTNYRTVRKADSYNTSLSPAAKDDYRAKRNRVWAAGDAPMQIASLSVFGNYKKLLVIFILYSERFAARAPRITTSAKQERLKRSVFPKGVNGSQGQRPPVPCGSEGKPDFPL